LRLCVVGCADVVVGEVVAMVIVIVVMFVGGGFLMTN
jgi:hypothetical protein